MVVLLKLGLAAFLVWWAVRYPVSAGHEIVRSGDLIGTRFGDFVASAEAALRTALPQHAASTNEILKGAK